MTTTTVHRIDVADLHTFRLRCQNSQCRQAVLAEVNTWSSIGGRTKCPHCGTDWGNAGEGFASLMAGLRILRGVQNPEVLIQVEVEAGTEAPAS